MARAKINLQILLACVLSLVLGACQGEAPISASRPAPAAADVQRLALCDGQNVWQYDVPEDGILSRSLLLKLPDNAHCPEWSPLTREAIVSIQATNDNRAMADMRSARQLLWFNAHTQTLDDYTALLSTDVSYEPLWQRDGKPMLAVTSARDVANDCGALTAMYAAASSSVTGVRDAAARAAQTTAQNALSGGAMSVAITAQVVCRVVKPELFLITPDGAALQMLALPDPICDLSLAPGGVWMLATTGICRRNTFGRTINLIRIDTGQVITVPLDPAVHSIQQAIWQTASSDAALPAASPPRLIITAQRLAGTSSRKKMVLDVFLFSPKVDIGEDVNASNNLQLLMSSLDSLDLVHWLTDGSLLLVRDRAVYRMHMTDVAPALVARLPAPAQRCVSQFAVSADERFILQHDSCDGLVGQLVWTELSTGKLQSVLFSRTVSGYSLFSPNGSWIATEALERYQFTIRSRILLIRKHDGKIIDLGIQPSAVQLDWLQE